MKASHNHRLNRAALFLGLIAGILGLAALVCGFVAPWKSLTNYFLVPCVVLSFLAAIPLSYSFAGPLDDPALKHCNVPCGEICLPSKALIVSDQWDFRDARQLSMAGTQLSVSAVIRKGMIKSVRIKTTSDGVRKLNNFAELGVDTGHLIFADRDILQHIDSKTISERILLVLSSKEPLTLFLMDSQNRLLGFAVGTGHGDGQYTVRSDSPVDASCVECCFF
jgi:hypothetical protein